MQIAWVQGLSDEGSSGAKKKHLNVVRSHAAKVARSRQSKTLKESCPNHDHFLDECLECWRVNQRKSARNRAVVPLLPKSNDVVVSTKPRSSNFVLQKTVFNPPPKWFQIYASVAAFQMNPLYEVLNTRRVLTRNVLVVMHNEACFHALTALMLDVHAKTIDANIALSQQPLTHVGKAMELLRAELSEPKPQNKAAIMTAIYALAAFEFQRFGQTRAHKAHKDILTTLCQQPAERAEDEEPTLKWIKTVIEQNGFTWSVKPGYSVLGEPLPFPTLTYPHLPISDTIAKKIRVLPEGFQTLIKQGRISNQLIIVLQRTCKRNEQMKNTRIDPRLPEFADTDEEGRPPSTHFWQACPSLLVKDDDFDNIDQYRLQEERRSSSKNSDHRIISDVALEKIISLTIMLFVQHSLNSVPAMHTTTCTVLRSRLTMALLKIASLVRADEKWTENNLNNELRAQEECLFWSWQFMLQTWVAPGSLNITDTIGQNLSLDTAIITQHFTQRFNWIYVNDKAQEILNKFFWTSRMQLVRFWADM